MDDDHLRILYRQIHVILLQERHLREIPRKYALLYNRGIHLKRRLIPHRNLQFLQNSLQLSAHVEGRTKVPVVQEIFITPVDILVLSLVLEESIHQSEMVALLTHKFCMGVSGLPELVLRPQENIGSIETGNNRDNFIDAVVFGRTQQHFRELRFQGEFSHALALRSQVAIVIQCPQIIEKLQCSHQCLRGGWVHEIEMNQVVNSQFFESEDSIGQIRPQNLRVSIIDQLLLICCFSIQSETFARSSTTSSTGPLFGTGATDRRNQQRFYPHARIEHLLLGKTRVNHVNYAVDCYTGLRDIGGHDYLTSLNALFIGFWRRLEDALLLVRRKSAVKWDDRDRTYPIAHLLDFFLNFSTSSLDLFLPRQKQQNIAFSLILVNSHCRPYRSLHVICLWLFAEIDIDRVHPPRNVQPRRALKVLLELHRVHGRRHHDQFQISPSRQDLLYEAEQHISVESPLVGLVEDDHRVFVEVGVDHGLPQQHTVSHILEDGPAGGEILKPYRVSHFLPQLHVHLLRDALRHRHRRHPSRLRTGNALSPTRQPRLDQKLRNLSGLTRSCLSDQDDDLVLLDERDQFRLALIGRQLLSGLQEGVIVRGVGLSGEVVDVLLDALSSAIELLLFIVQSDPCPHVELNTITNYQAIQQMDFRTVVHALTQGKPLPEHTLKEVCRKFSEVLAEEGNVVHIEGPINIIGDVHGQFYDVLKIFKLGGELPTAKYLFLGDYVDRGYNSLQTILLLAAFKILHPDRIFLLRGNHQSRQISSMYGFYQETQKKYGSTAVWKIFNDAFDYLPLAAIVNRSIFCLHGGLSPDIHTIQDIDDLDRVCQVPTSGPGGDLMWSDPEQIENWAIGSRGVGWLFGWRATNQFLQHNWLQLVVRSHQLVERGVQEWFKARNLLTVWSAPNYCYRCGNVAAIMKVAQDGTHSFEMFGEDERSASSVHYNQLIPYFL